MRIASYYRIIYPFQCKYSGKDKSVTLTLIKEQGKAKISVHNTGNPINKADIPHIFERFYRADKSRANMVQTDGGHGLGLSIAKSIADTHGGKLTVTSSAEHGTTFTAEFPSK